MKDILFYSDECLKIENQKQFNEARHILRNPNMEWSKPFPIYFEHSNSVSRGSSIGITCKPVDTWTGEPLKVVSLDEALSRNN